MERREILEQLKRTEADVHTRIEAANKKAAEMKDHAMKQAKTLQRDAERQASEETARRVAEVKAALAKDRKRAVAAAETEAEALKGRIQVSKVKSFFLSKFIEYLHA
jgi:vacuolar-type H+-ATPase subunit H